MFFMTYHAMMFFWKLSEKHWLLRPFEIIGDLLEDLGLERGYVTFNDRVISALKKASKEYDEDYSQYIQNWRRY
jgi:hypothetical protein